LINSITDWAMSTSLSSRSLDVQPLAMRFAQPFRIAGYAFEAMPSVLATIGSDGRTGRGEAAGVYYRGDDQAHMIKELERARPLIVDGLSRPALQQAIPAGGARNALDCALWELESKLAETPVWKLAGTSMPRPMVSTFTLAADDPSVVAAKVRNLDFAQAIKLKFDGDLDADGERLKVVRNHRPDAWIAVDANQGYVADDLDGLERLLVGEQVSLLEQPLPRGEEGSLDGWNPPFPIAADESILDLSELEEFGEAFDVINIKLDKCGGLTEALAMARRARAMGRQLMVGNMGGSALAMAPAFILAQLCDVVDLDGPWGLADAADSIMLYTDGMIDVPEGYWGA
jgi:L-alanine-DL-glutamate epimerase-like enolase superfamily enzyme